MIRGLYTGASGMNAQQVRLDAISNNLANVDTNGYKRDTAVHKAFAQLLVRRMDDDGVMSNPFGTSDLAPVIGKLGTGVENNEVFTQFEQARGFLTECIEIFAVGGGHQEFADDERGVAERLAGEVDEVILIAIGGAGGSVCGEQGIDH